MLHFLLVVCMFQTPNYQDSVDHYKHLWGQSQDSIMWYSNKLVQTKDKVTHAKYLKIEESWMDKCSDYFDKIFYFEDKLDEQKAAEAAKKARET